MYSSLLCLQLLNNFIVIFASFLSEPGISSHLIRLTFWQTIEKRFNKSCGIPAAFCSVELAMAFLQIVLKDCIGCKCHSRNRSCSIMRVYMFKTTDQECVLGLTVGSGVKLRHFLRHINSKQERSFTVCLCRKFVGLRANYFHIHQYLVPLPLFARVI